MTDSGTEEWGPDLALIRIPGVIASDIAVVKAFYDFDRRRGRYAETIRYDRGLWNVIGAPEELSNFGAQEASLHISLFSSWITKASERDGLDYVDLAYGHEERSDLPHSYGGISGSGLWQIQPTRSKGTGDISWNDTVQLEGVAFYQKVTGDQRGVIRCHGRKSLFRILDQ